MKWGEPMFLNKKKDNKSIDVEGLNEVIGLSKRFLKVAVILLILGGIYGVTLLLREWNIPNFLLTLIKIVAPLFIGLVVAWLFDPFVKWLERRKIKRGVGTLITYLLLIGGIVIIISAIIPVLTDQISDFVHSIPGIIETVQSWLDGVLNRLTDIDGFDVEAFKGEMFKQIDTFGKGLTQSLPTMTVEFVKSFFSGMGTFLVGLIIGFYLLMSFDNVGDTLITLFPKRIQSDTKSLSNSVNGSLRRYVQGAVLDCTFVFLVTSLGLWLVGLKAPLLFGLFCGITNIIPYAGPYIGGAPAVIVGFSQGPLVGILTLAVIALIQFLEGNFLQPIIMSKTTKLHPVTIMLGLLIFGHFWGIIGMIVSTPLIAGGKAIFMFFDEKFHFFASNENTHSEE